MPWQPIQLPISRPAEGLDSVLGGVLDRRERRHQFDTERADQAAAHADALKREQEAQFRAAYDDVVKGYHEGKYTEDEARSKLSQFGAVFAPPGGPAAPPQQPPAPQLNPLSRAVAAQSMGQQAIAPSASAAIPGGSGPLDAMNAAITAKTLDPRQAGPTQPPMMPTPGVSGPPSAPPPAAPQAMQHEQPAPANQLFRAAEASKQQDAARAGTLKFKRNGQDYSVSSRNEILAAQKHEKEAQIQDQLAKFDAALAESPDDPYLKKIAPMYRAMVRSGEDPQSRDTFGMMGREINQEGAEKRKQEQIDAARQNLVDILEPGRNKRALITAGTGKYKADSMNEAIHYSADKRAEQGGENNEIKRESQGNSELSTYLRNTKFSGQVQSGRRLREAARLAAAQGDNTAMAQHEALVELVSRANGGASVTQGKMDYLVGNMAGKMDWLAQQTAALRNGKLSPEQEAGLMKTVQIGSEAYDHERGVLDEGVKKLLNHHKMDPVRKNDLYHAYMQSLGEDANPDPFPAAPETAPQNPLQRAASAGKAKDKAGAAQLGGIVERTLKDGRKVKVRKVEGGWEVVQ